MTAVNYCLGTRFWAKLKKKTRNKEFRHYIISGDLFDASGGFFEVHRDIKSL